MHKSEINNLMKDVQRQDEVAFENLFNETKKGVFSFLYTYVKDYYLAEDLVQETFIKVKLNAQNYKLGTNASAWILQIAKNTAIDFLRKEKKTVDMEEVVINQGEPNFDEKLVLHNALNNNLNGNERQIVLLHIVYGYKHREISKILGIPVGTVLWKYNMSLKRLKSVLAEAEYEE
ncbi:MAG: RNA polymerase sigma factor [Clostridia bacterium]|nr:RNA polymerase sigma factor [Clostridia bacterium]